MFAPLDDVVVLDLSRYLPGPFLTRILVDLGAQVIKVEPPGGDTLRWMPPSHEGLGAGFVALHAGKRSVCLDLKKPEGGALLRAMARRADVLVEAFRPGVLDRLGVGPSVLHAENPRLIIASLSGYGQMSSMRDAAGHDLNYLARAGILSLQGPADVPPAVPGVQVADLGGGGWPAAVGILAALRERERTGRGRHLDFALARGALAFGCVPVAAAALGSIEGRGDGLLTGGVPCYRCYATKDGRHLSVGALEPQFWRAFCQAIDRPDLLSEAFAVGAARDRIVDDIQATLATRTLAEWVAVFSATDACCEAVRTMDEVLADPDFQPWLTEVGGHTVVRPDLGAPGEHPALSPPPSLGADADDVLARLGVDPALVNAAAGVGALLR